MIPYRCIIIGSLICLLIFSSAASSYPSLSLGSILHQLTLSFMDALMWIALFVSILFLKRP